MSCFSIFLGVFSWQVKNITLMIRTRFVGIWSFIGKTKESIESMEVEFILMVKSTCFFKNHHFYAESVAPISKWEFKARFLLART